jgi:dTDP-4-amino-4,6-dideoxygalactose transaminase
MLVRNRKSLLCNSRTAALYSAYFGLGFSPGAEILVPSNTFKATVTALFL